MDNENRDQDVFRPGETQSSSGSGMPGRQPGTMRRDLDQDYEASTTHETPMQRPGQTTMQQGSMTEQAAEKAREKTGQVKEQAGEMAEKAQHRAKTMLDQQKGRAAESLGSVAHALRSVGDQLDQEQQGGLGRFADQAADRMEQLSNDLRDRNINDLIREAEGFARREPQVFLGGALVLGVMLARFFKSSSPEPDYGYQGSGYGPYERRTSPRVYGTSETWTEEERFRSTPTSGPYR